MNMVGLLAWACLCAIAQSIVMEHPFTPTEGQEVTSPATDGAGFSSNLFWVSMGLPSDDWGLGGWIFLRSAADTAQLMRVSLANSYDFYFYWPATGKPTFNLAGEDHSDPTAPSTRDNNKWFHVAMGSQGGKSQGVVTLRGVATQLEIQWVAIVKMVGKTTLMGPVGDSTFSVREI